MTIDEAIEFEKYLSKQPEVCNEDFMKCEEHGQIAEWLEELKILKSLKNCSFMTIGKTVEQFEQEIRCKAIDDFAETCKQNILCQTFGLHPINIDKIAEQLKAGDRE